MRRIYRFSIMVLALLATMSAASAEAWLERISGNRDDVTVNRNGMPLPPSELMRLQPGDEIDVSGGTTVRVLMGSGAITVVSRAQSPFTLPGDGTDMPLLANLVNEAKNMLSASSRPTATVAMVTRGKSDDVRLQGAAAEENFVPMNDEDVAVSWGGGRAPYELSLIGVDIGEVVASSELPAGSGSEQGFDGRLHLTDLEPGEYRIKVASKGDKGSVAEANVTLVGVEDLPDEAQKLLELRLDKRVEARLMINLLHHKPEWRFYTLDLAIRYGLDEERQVIVAMN